MAGATALLAGHGRRCRGSRSGALPSPPAVHEPRLPAYERMPPGFADILARWPRSVHAGEASVGLGWLLLEAGERAEARLRFAIGASDPTPSVRAEALRGLSAAR